MSPQSAWNLLQGAAQEENPFHKFSIARAGLEAALGRLGAADRQRDDAQAALAKVVQQQEKEREQHLDDLECLRERNRSRGLDTTQ